MPKLVLRDFQKEDVLFMRKHNYNVLNANAPGTGKTIEILASIGIDRKLLCPAIIVAPASVTDNWQIEANKWLPWARAHVIKNRKQPLPQKLCHIYIISWSLLADRAMELLSVRPKLLVADEAHFAKNEEASRSQVLYGLARRIPHRLMLTGTPLVNHEGELEAIKGLYPNSDPPMLRRFIEVAAPDVPPKERCLLPVQLPRKHAKEYQRAQDEFATWLQDRLKEKFEGANEAEAAHKRALAAEALVKIGYLRRLVGIAKTNAAVDWAARAVRIGEPVVIFAEHQNVIERLSNSMRQQRLRHVIIDGSTPKRKRQEKVEAFQNGTVPIFIGSKAAATGITLHRARHLLFCERFWTYAEEEQAEDRIRRIGQKFPTKMWYLHANGTIDDRIARIIERKRNLTEEHIGIEDVSSAPEDVVMDLIKWWSANAEAPQTTKESMLGIAKALPPLPSPQNACQIIFAGKRWNNAAIKAWADMNAYILKKIRFDGRLHRATIRPPTEFVKGTFKTFPISKEIKIIVGQRIKRRRGPKPRSHGFRRFLP